ncbi:MAG TPA: hypothetical protein VFM65_00860 [Flavobacteriaceae bacterium]|nr:hypothetical protein [Flavobacteriaceae bacterium]
MTDNNYAFMVLILLALTACKENQKKSVETSGEEKQVNKTLNESTIGKISEGKVASFEIGDKIPQNIKKYQIQQKEQTRYTEGGPVKEVIYILSKEGEKHLVLKPEFDPSTKSYNQTIAEIFVFSEKYKTAENIGVGSTLTEFSKAYPDFKIWYTYVSDRYVAENSNSSIQFLLNEKDFKGNIQPEEVKVPLQLDDFSEGAKISKIRIYQ